MKTWILGFDGSCLKCARLARQIQRISNKKLKIENLHSPEVRAWRKTSTGEDLPLVPTLFEIEGEHVKSYIGVRMTVHLLKILGPLKAGKVLWILGKESSFPDYSTSNKRRRFLQNLIGGVAATSLISLGKAPFAQSAITSEDIQDILESVNVEPADAAERQRHLAVANSDANFIKLKNHLEQNNFVVSSDPDIRVITGKQDSSSVASSQKYSAIDNTIKGELIFIRRDDDTTESCLVITDADEDKLPYSLYVDSTGNIKSITYDEVTELLGRKPDRQEAAIICSVCTTICAASRTFCPLGPALGCATVCNQLPFPLPACEAVCVPLFATICAGCRVNICRAICSAPLPR